MTTQTAHRQIVFLIDTFYQGKDLKLTFRLDQRVAHPGQQREENRLYNQVQKHLSDLGRRTGFDYSIRFWGYPEMVDEYLEEQGITLY